jgi:adenylate kinase family enzyme
LNAFPRRIVVTGVSGMGKTTVARRIARMAGIPHVELDALHWEPEWTPADPDVFRERVEAATAGDAWVADGGYSQVRDLTWARAQHMIWLDFTLVRTLWQLTGRTFGRVARREELWSGNREKLHMHFLSRDSLYLWVLQTHGSKRKRYPAYLDQPEMRHLTVVRARNPRELEAHMSHLQQLLSTEQRSTSETNL